MKTSDKTLQPARLSSNERAQHGFLGPDRWWHLTFGTLMAISLIAFIYWSIGYVGPHRNYLLLLTTIAFGVFMAFNIGGNDVANSFGTSVGAGTLTIKQALLVAAVFEVAGAVIAGGSVTETVRSGIIDLEHAALSPQDFVYIMMAALLGAALWLLIATRKGWPVSTTHAIIGGIVGAGILIGTVSGSNGLEMVQWSQIGSIAISWILSPLLGGMTSFILFRAIKRHILVYNDEAEARLSKIKAKRDEHRRRHKARVDALTTLQKRSYTRTLARDAALFRRGNVDASQLESDYFKELLTIDQEAKQIHAHRALEIWVPILAAIGAMIICSMMLFKGLKNLHLGLDTAGNLMIMGMVGIAVWMAVFIFAKTLKNETLSRSTFLMFSWMQVFTASAFAFSHGSNDIANAVGPFAAVVDVIRSQTINAKAAVPTPILVMCGIALIVGLWFIGRKVIRTVGEGLTKMHPASGFAAELASACVVMAASLLGLPVSSTHILIGAVLGVGMVNKAANWKLMRPIGLAWVITLPASACIGAATAFMLRLIFGA